MKPQNLPSVKILQCSEMQLALLPVELQHEAGDGHASRDLEGHAADEVHAVSGVGVEGRVVQLLGVVELFLCGAGGDRSRPREQHIHT